MTGDFDYTKADPDLKKGHPILQVRWASLHHHLQEKYGFVMRVVEVYRPDRRQQWLFGSGRSIAQLLDEGIPAEFARPNLPRITMAPRARLSAHGATQADGTGQMMPASAALDVVPVGEDGRPWTQDDPWDAFVVAIAAEGSSHGLVHFHQHGKQVTDRPHLQLWPEWSDQSHTLTF